MRVDHRLREHGVSRRVGRVSIIHIVGDLDVQVFGRRRAFACRVGDCGCTCRELGSPRSRRCRAVRPAILHGLHARACVGIGDGQDELGVDAGLRRLHGSARQLPDGSRGGKPVDPIHLNGSGNGFIAGCQQEGVVAVCINRNAFCRVVQRCPCGGARLAVFQCFRARGRNGDGSAGSPACVIGRNGQVGRRAARCGAGRRAEIKHGGFVIGGARGIVESHHVEIPLAVVCAAARLLADGEGEAGGGFRSFKLIGRKRHPAGGGGGGRIRPGVAHARGICLRCGHLNGRLSGAVGDAVGRNGEFRHVGNHGSCCGAGAGFRSCSGPVTHVLDIARVCNAVDSQRLTSVRRYFSTKIEDIRICAADVRGCAPRGIYFDTTDVVAVCFVNNFVKDQGNHEFIAGLVSSAGHGGDGHKLRLSGVLQPDEMIFFLFHPFVAAAAAGAVANGDLRFCNRENQCGIVPVSAFYIFIRRQTGIRETWDS